MGDGSLFQKPLPHFPFKCSGSGRNHVPAYNKDKGSFGNILSSLNKGDDSKKDKNFI